MLIRLLVSLYRPDGISVIVSDQQLSVIRYPDRRGATICLIGVHILYKTAQKLFNLSGRLALFKGHKYNSVPIVLRTVPGAVLCGKQSVVIASWKAFTVVEF